MMTDKCRMGENARVVGKDTDARNQPVLITADIEQQQFAVAADDQRDPCSQ